VTDDERAAVEADRLDRVFKQLMRVSRRATRSGMYKDACIALQFAMMTASVAAGEARSPIYQGGLLTDPIEEFDDDE